MLFIYRVNGIGGYALQFAFFPQGFSGALASDDAGALVVPVVTTRGPLRVRGKRAPMVAYAFGKMAIGVGQADGRA
jgi:hypothetical protein